MSPFGERLAMNSAAAPPGPVEVNIHEAFPFECQWVDMLLRRSLVTGRCSPILRNFMVIWAAGVAQKADDKFHRFDPKYITQTMRVLEGLDSNDRTKGPFRYHRGPLRGLYRKHFFEPQFIPHNAQIELEKNGQREIRKAFKAALGTEDIYGHTLTREEASEVARLAAEGIVSNALERRAARRAKGRDGGLTGEHLIYARTKAGNIYLYAAFHSESQQRILECVQVVVPEFPDIKVELPHLFADT